MALPQPREAMPLFGPTFDKFNSPLPESLPKLLGTLSEDAQQLGNGFPSM